MSRQLNDICPKARPLFFELIARCVEKGLAICIVDTLRTPEEQAENLARKVSWTLDSKHLPQQECSLSHAIDLAPFDEWRLHGRDKIKWGSDPAWQVMGEIGEKLGLRWGGRWKVRDLGHFEIPSPHPHLTPADG